MKSSKGRLLFWFNTGYLFPPVIWMVSGLLIRLWTWQELLRIIKNPWMWLYIAFYLIVLNVITIIKLKGMSRYQKDPSEKNLVYVQKALAYFPKLFLIGMAFYIVFGPIIALLEQTMHDPFLDKIQYILAEFLAVPLLLLFCIPFYILFIIEAEKFSQNIPLPEGKYKFLGLRGKLSFSILFNLAGAILSLGVGSISLTYIHDSLSGMGEFTIRLSILSLMIIGFAVFNTYMIIHQIITPINKVTSGLSHVFETFSQGKGKLQYQLEIYSRDEIGYLKSHFNAFIKSLEEMILHIKYAIRESGRKKDEILESVEISKIQTQQIVQDSDAMQVQFQTLSSEIVQSDQYSQEVGGFIQNVNTRIKLQSEAISQASASIHNITSSIQNAADDSQKKLEIAHSLEETALSGERDMVQSLKVIEKVHDSASVILEMMGVINNVSEQTNMLAMNAAIEAAHAGEAGQGFAIVSQEIRELAEATSKNAEDISHKILQIMQDIADSRQFTENSVATFQKILEHITAVATGMIVIQYAMQDLSQESSEIIGHLNELVSSSKGINQASGEIKEKIGAITGSLTQLRSIAETTGHTFNGITQALQGLNEVVARTAAHGLENAENFNRLSELVEGFEEPDEEKKGDV